MPRRPNIFDFRSRLLLDAMISHSPFVARWAHPALAVIVTGLAWAVAAAPCQGQAPPDSAETPTASPTAPAGPTAEVGRLLLPANSLEGWKVATKYDFEDHGEITVKDGELTLAKGDPAPGSTGMVSCQE